MRKSNAWVVLAIGGLAGAAFAQTQSPPAGNSPEAQPTPQASGAASASSPHQRDLTNKSAAEAAPNSNTGPTAASSPHQRTATRMAEAGPSGTVKAGMMVTDRSGESLGTVARVTPETARHRYVVVTGKEGNATPVPYTVASSMMAAGKIVLDRDTFEQAPKVPPSQASRSPRNWQTKVDRYWSSQAR